MEGVRVDVPHQEIEEVEEIVAEDAVALGKKVATEKGRLASMLIYKICFFTSRLSVLVFEMLIYNITFIVYRSRSRSASKGKTDRYRSRSRSVSPKRSKR